MFQYPVGRIVESERIAGFLRAVESWPAALVLDGEAGIGKSTVWEAGLQRAREAGMHVLSARAWGAESVRAWATIAELLADVTPDIVADLPEVQRGAVTGLLMRDRLDEPSDQAPVANSQVLAAAMLSIIDALEHSAPVLIAIDDLQWLDPSSQAVIGFVARRVRRRTALLLTHRTDADAGQASTAWLHLDSVNGIQRMQLHPLTLGGLHEVIAQRLGRSFPRPTVVRIADVSGGNPFYALELARALGNRPLRSDTELPTSLAELVRLRVGALSDEVRAVLLVTASTSDPTVETVSAAMGASVERTVELLESSEGAGVVTVIGNRVRFNHPLLAQGVYTDAEPQQRRQVHRSPWPRWTRPPPWRGTAELPLRPPSCSSWPSGSAPTRPSAESRLPTITFVPETPGPRRRSSLRPSSGRRPASPDRSRSCCARPCTSTPRAISEGSRTCRARWPMLPVMRC